MLSSVLLQPKSGVSILLATLHSDRIRKLEVHARGDSRFKLQQRIGPISDLDFFKSLDLPRGFTSLGILPQSRLD